MKKIVPGEELKKWLVVLSIIVCVIVLFKAGPIVEKLGKAFAQSQKAHKASSIANQGAK